MRSSMARGLSSSGKRRTGCGPRFVSTLIQLIWYTNTKCHTAPDMLTAYADYMAAALEAFVVNKGKIQ